MQLDNAIKEALSGRAVLFLGAGFSTEAKSRSSAKIPTATEFSYQLCNQLAMDKDNELEYTSEQFIERFGISRIITELKDSFNVTEVTPNQMTIIDMPWTRIYTTNYDNVVSKASKKTIPIATLSDNPQKYYNKKGLCIHLNGYIENLSEETLNNEFKLTTKSYLTEDFVTSSWLDMFREDVKNCRAIFFIGCSLNYDLDIKRILSGIPDLNRKCFFITLDTIPQKTETKMNYFGDVIKDGVDGFASKILEVKKDFKVEINSDIELFDFELFDDSISPITEIKDDDIFNLFRDGEYKLENIKSSLDFIKPKKYMVKRFQIEKIVKNLNKDKKLVIIHSDLGNGKTGLVKMLKFELSKFGKIYELKKASNLTITDFEKIANKNEKSFVIIESYQLYFNIISKFKVFMNDNIKFIMTARTLTNDVSYFELLKRLDIKSTEVEVYSVNKLVYSETESLIDIFDEYTLWGKYANLSRESKRKRFKTLNNDFQSILLSIDSDFIKGKLLSISESIKEETSYYKVVILVLLNEVMERILELDDLIYLLDSSLLYNQSFLRDPMIGEVIDLKNYCPIIKSSIVAKYILETANNSNALINILIDILKKADKKTYINKYKNLFRYLVSFSNIKYLLYYDKVNFNNLLIVYYENIKNLSYNRKNSFFWMQYAIARLELKQYTEAKIYFDNAYAYSKNISNFDTIQIDTHYARYILENQIYKGADKEAFNSFREAHSIIMRKREMQHLHYPLRRINIYYEYYQKYFDTFKDSEKIYFIDACVQAKGKIEGYFEKIDKDYRRRDHLVVESHKQLDLIINETNDFHQSIKSIAATK